MHTPLPLLLSQVSGAVCIGVLYAQFRHSLPVDIRLPRVDPDTLLTDRYGAVIGAANMGLCLLLLVLAPTLGWDMWVITLICALLHMTYNFVTMVAAKQGKLRWRHTGSGSVSVEFAEPVRGVWGFWLGVELGFWVHGHRRVSVEFAEPVKGVCGF